MFSQALTQDVYSSIVPFNYYQSLIILKAKIGDQEGNFILDTGANGLVLNSQYFSPTSVSNHTAYGISGEVSKIGKSEVEEMEMEQLVFHDLEAENIDLTEIENKKNIKILGLIGYDVIKDYEIMLNYRERYVTFSKLDDQGEMILKLPHTQEKIDSFSFTLGNFIPVIEVKIGDESKRMGIDTGAEYNVLDNKRNRNVLENFKVINRINISGADGKQKQALAGILYRLKLSEKYKCASMATILTNMNYLNQIYGTNLDGILGHGFLAPWIFSINYKQKKIYLHKIYYGRT
ncbi:hypothetical protein GCM10007940_15880 [Portibacter lacus]|uniref:Aspartyl protease n=1 Tax=Portibacter lacus TaxID=1099794 RepID=A0AA37SLX5_9BACT|nr:hypothetical protein GCM10007940_15880 [Portibacter lacus]